MFTRARISRLSVGTMFLAGSLALGLVAVSGASPATSRVIAHPAYPACTAAGLVNWLNTQGQGAAGTIYYELRFTNLSGHTCTLMGYPKVTAVNLSNGQLGGVAPKVTAYVHVVTLANGATARANLGIVQAGNFTPSVCHPTMAAGLRVYAPGQASAKIVPFPFAACAASNFSVLKIYPVTP